MKILSKIFCGALLFLYLNTNAIAQNRSIQLPEPTKIRTDKGGLLGGANDVGSIYYGAVPANASTKPVLVFIHGYNSNAKTWWENNTMYNKAFADGYRTAFVSVNPDKSYFVNGQMFSNMITSICTKYGVTKVNVIAHSKGGLDSDAMAVMYGGKLKIQRIITLGSPHFGTPLADLAQSGWVSWLTTPIGQNNAGTQSLQTGAVASFRSQISANANNSGLDFRTFGAYGYSGVLWVSGVYLSWNGGGSSNGGNDGVVNYSSTKRPNASVIFGTNDSRGNLNHFEIADGDKMWTSIKGQLTATAARGNANEEITPEKYNPNTATISASQIVSADKGVANFQVSSQAKKVRIEVYQSDFATPITLAQRNTNTQYNDWQTVNINTEGVFGSKAKILTLDNATAGTHELYSEKPFVAIIYTEDGVSATLTSDLNEDKLVYQTSESMNLSIALSKNNLQAQATGIITRVSDLNGNIAKETIAERLNFEWNNDVLTTKTKTQLPAGIYNVSIEVKGSDFSKSIVTSVAVVGEDITNLNQNEGLNAIAFPNPATEKVTFRFDVQQKGQHTIRVYNNTGKEMWQYDASNFDKGTHEITWELKNSVKNGLYFYELNANGKKVTKKLVIKD